MNYIDFTTLPDQPLLVAVSGHSGIGKNKIIRALLQKSPNRYACHSSYTSHKWHDQENDFEDTFTTTKDSVKAFIELGKFVIKIVHPSNHKKLRREHPNLISILISPSITNPAIFGHVGSDCDEKYYDEIDLTSFDIIYHKSNCDTSEEIAETINTAILAISKTNKYFPRPSIIDDVNRRGYTVVAEEFHDKKRITTAFFHKLSTSFFSKSIINYVKPGSTCLEVGSGSGWLWETFDWPITSYSATDLSANMLMSFHKKYPDLPAIEASARSLPWSAKKFDVIFASLCDPYCHPAVLCEFSRILKRGGYLIASAPAKMWSNGIRKTGNEVMTEFLLRSSSKAKVFSFTFHMKELLSLMRLCGLRPVDYQEIPAIQKNGSCELPPDIIASCNHLRISASQLNVMNCVVATKA